MNYSYVCLGAYIFFGSHSIIAMGSPYDSEESVESSSVSSGSDSPPQLISFLYRERSSSSDSDPEQTRQELVDYMLQDLYSACVKSTSATQSPAMSSQPLKKIPTPAQLLTQPALESRRSFSRFKEQLIDHDRLLVNKDTDHIMADERLSPNKVEQCNYLAQKLLCIIRSKPVKDNPSSWLLRADDGGSYIAYPLHLVISYGLQNWGKDMLISELDKKRMKEEQLLLGGTINATTDQEHVLKCIQILTDIGANPNAQDHLGRRPLYLLATQDDQDNAPKSGFKGSAASRLLFRGADIDGANRLGDTALTRAAQTGDIEYLRFLLSRNANPNIQSTHEDSEHPSVLACGTSPLWAATVRLNLLAIEILLEHHAKIKASEVPAAEMLLANTGSDLYKHIIKKVLTTRE